MFADFLLASEEPEEIKTLLGTERSVDRIYNIKLKDKNIKVRCIIEKTLHIAKKKD